MIDCSGSYTASWVRVGRKFSRDIWGIIENMQSFVSMIGIILLFVALTTGYFVYENRVHEPTVYVAPETENISESIPKEVTSEKEEVDAEDVVPEIEDDVSAPVPPPPPPLPPAETPLPVPITQPPLNIPPILSFDTINENVRKALVNIFCTVGGYHKYLLPISGSGIIIDKRGVILTNAHIAQYLLLKDFPSPGFINCIVRTGSPAVATYGVTLMYLVPDWISANADALTVEKPTGTGEHDFALLFIDRSLTQNPLPSEFPSVELDTTEGALVRGNEVFVGGYAAGFLGGSTVQKELYAVSSISTISELYTFHESTLDVISLGGNILAQQGSSGGAVVSKNGKLIGMISTSSEGETTSERDLRAITLAHIERSLALHGQTSLEILLSGDLAAKTTVFQSETAPGLLEILSEKLGG